MADYSAFTRDAIGNLLRGGGNGTSITAPAALFIKLHTGAPGTAGTSNAAGNTTRQAVTFGASSSGVITLSNSPTWTSVSTTETYTHVSIWDSATVGNCWLTGALTVSKAVTAGDTFTMSTLTLTNA